jgi:hypothetical protein
VDLNVGADPHDGILLENCVLQGSTANIIVGDTNVKIVARLSRFNDSPSVGGGQITVNATGCLIELDECTFGVPVIDGSQAAAAIVKKTGPSMTRSAAPAAGAWRVGDVVWNSAPAAAGTIGWVCTAAGSPGTWKTFGTIAA